MVHGIREQDTRRNFSTEGGQGGSPYSFKYDWIIAYVKMIIGAPYLHLICNVSNGGDFHKSVHGAEMMIGLVLMLLVKLFFVESLIVEADVFFGLNEDFLVKRAATCRSLLLWMSLAAVAVANSSSMHAAARAAKAWGHLLIDVRAGILTPFSL